MALSSIKFHGKVCRIEKGGTAMSFSRGWSINATLDMADTSAQADAWKSALPGLAGWTGSFEMYYAPGNTEQAAFVNNLVNAAPGTKLTDVKFLQDVDTNAFIGDLYVTGLAVTTSIGGPVTATVTFQGDGALSQVANA